MLNLFKSLNIPLILNVFENHFYFLKNSSVTNTNIENITNIKYNVNLRNFESNLIPILQ